MSRDELGYTQNQRKVLDAALRRLQAAEVEWSRGITFDQLESDTGVDRSDIAKAFGNKDKLISELVDYALTPGDARFALDKVEVAVGELLSGGNIRDAVIDIGRADDEYHRTDQMLVAQMAIWALGRSRSDVRKKLADLYGYFDDGHREVFEALLAQLQPQGVRLVAGLSVDEFVAILSAVAEGTAIRGEADPGLVSPDLTSKAMLMLFEAGLRLPDEEVALGDKLVSMSGNPE